MPPVMGPSVSGWNGLFRFCGQREHPLVFGEPFRMREVVGLGFAAAAIVTLSRFAG